LHQVTNNEGVLVESGEKINAQLAVGIFILCFAIQIFVFSFIQYYFQVIAGWEFDSLGQFTTIGGIWGVWVGLIITEALLLVIVIIVLYLRSIKFRSLIKKNEKILSYTIIGIPLMFIVGLGAGYIQLLFMNLFGIQLPASTQALAEFLTPHNGFELIIWILIMFLVVAPSEEIFARACVQEGFQNSLSERNNGNIYAVIISSICFMIFHVDPFRFFPIFCESLVLGYVYYKSDSVISTIIIHGAGNSIILILAMFGI